MTGILSLAEDGLKRDWGDMEKLAKLRSILSNYKKVIVAYSGGVDSSFLLKVAGDTLPKKNLVAVTAVSETYTRSELKQAKRIAKKIGVEHKIILTNELKDKNFAKNPIDRCYYCKKELFGRLELLSMRNGHGVVVDASNLDDKKDYRPGTIAKKECGVRSPLQEAGLTKDDIRKLSKKMNVETWNYPSMACLASRIPYGQKINKPTLRKIEKAEVYIKKQGIREIRVRCHDKIARIEVGQKEIKRFLNKKFCDKIIKYLKSLGFSYVVLDLEGYRTGSLNEVL